VAGIAYVRKPHVWQDGTEWRFTHFTLKGLERFGPWPTKAEADTEMEKYVAEYRDPIWPGLNIWWC
jgi:hypothetical protein